MDNKEKLKYEKFKSEIDKDHQNKIVEKYIIQVKYRLRLE